MIEGIEPFFNVSFLKIFANSRFKKGLLKDIKISAEEKERKQQYGREQYKNLPAGEKHKLVDYRKQ